MGAGFGNEQGDIAMDDPNEGEGMLRGEGGDVFSGILGRSGETRESAFAQFGEGGGIQDVERPVGGEIEFVGAREEIERREIGGLPEAVAGIEEMPDLRGECFAVPRARDHRQREPDGDARRKPGEDGLDLFDGFAAEFDDEFGDARHVALGKGGEPARRAGRSSAEMGAFLRKEEG